VVAIVDDVVGVMMLACTPALMAVIVQRAFCRVFIQVARVGTDREDKYLFVFYRKSGPYTEISTHVHLKWHRPVHMWHSNPANGLPSVISNAGDVTSCDACFSAFSHR
jgi:hypothetical protein